MRLSKILIPAACLALVACGDDDNDKMTVEPPVVTPPTTMTYEFMVTAVNLTQAQPMSPLGSALHTSGQFWQIGEMASEPLEVLAESGDNSGLLALDVVNVSTSSDVVLMPGQKVELMLTSEMLEGQKLSLISMMVNTNDGFTGLNAIDVSSMSVGDMQYYKTFAYDAGTEANSEAPGTIPGPADGGEGFNSAREEINKVAMHPGVVGQDDGLSTSVLTSLHKFDNPLLAVTVKRVK